MSQYSLSHQEIPAKLPPLNSKLFQIDFMKVIAIFFVIMDHTFTHAFLNKFFSSFWERTSIPIFMVIMGFNLGLSFHRKYKDRDNLELKELYTRDYFESRIRRYIIPYLILYFIQLSWIIIQTSNIPIIQNNPYYESSSYILLGYSPFWGPGMWFIPVLFTTILTMPVFYYFFRQDPKTMLLGCIIIELFFQFFSKIISAGFPQTLFFFLNNILNMASAIGLGIWMVNGFGLYEKKNKFYFSLFLVSSVLMVIFSLYKIDIISADSPLLILFSFSNSDYGFIFFGYSAFLVLLGLNYLPENPKGKLANIVRKMSKSTYHILLTQILYFSYIYHFAFDIETGFQDSPINYLWFFPLNVIITFSIGVLWHTLERRFYRNLQEKRYKQVIYKGLLGIGAIFFVIRFFSQFVFLFL